MEPRPGTAFSLEVTPRLPKEISRLEELANNLWFSWNRPSRNISVISFLAIRPITVSL